MWTLVQVMAWCVMHQAITWANVDSDLCRHMVSLLHNELNYAFLILLINFFRKCTAITQATDHSLVDANSICVMNYFTGKSVTDSQVSGFVLVCCDFKAHFYEIWKFCHYWPEKQHNMGLDMSNISSPLCLFPSHFLLGDLVNANPDRVLFYHSVSVTYLVTSGAWGLFSKQWCHMSLVTYQITGYSAVY